MITLLSSQRGRPAGMLAVTLALSVAWVALAHASPARANIKAGQIFTPNTYPRTITAFFAR
jgi:hypothetical protein